jgi:hypothetical protein
VKKVVSVSLGSSKRNHKVETEILGEKFTIERIGTDGSLARASELIREFDGRVDAFGLGGTDLYICAGKKRYVIREAKRLAKAATKTPIVDGSGLKNTLERKTIKYLHEKENIDFSGKNVLLVCAVDRFGMAESFESCGAKMTYGDLMFGLGIPVPVYSLNTLNKIAGIIAPIVCQLPFKYLYPTGSKQEENDKKRFEKYYKMADIIAGDFHYIKKHLPDNLPGKTIITNTVTLSDIEALRNAGVEKLITTTPNLDGRSFGTNVMEAVLVALSGKKPQEISVQDYENLLDKMNFVPRIEHLHEDKEAVVNG